MALFTVRREIDAIEPTSQLRPNIKRFRWIAAALLALIATAAQAQFGCPMNLVGGNNQTTFAGTRFSLPLVAGVSGISVALPNPVQVVWNVDPPAPPLGTVYFEQSLTTSFSENPPWSAVFPFSFSSSVNVIAEPNSNGVYTIRATSPPTCTSADTTFNINVVQPPLPAINLFQGNGQSAVSGTSFATPLGVLVTQGAGANPVPGAKATFTIVSGPASFSNGTNTISVFSDATGRALADMAAFGGVSVLSPVTVQVQALGVTNTYTGLQVTPAGVATLTPNPSVSGNYSAAQGQAFTETFSVALLDNMGLPIPAANVVFQLIGGSGAQLVVGGNPVGVTATQQTNVSGLSGVQVRAGAPGAFTLSAATAGFSTVTWNLSTVAGTQDIVIQSGDNQSTPTQNPFPLDLVAQARNGSIAVAGIPITFSVLSGDAYFMVGNGIPAASTTVQTLGAPAAANAKIIAGFESGNVVVQASSPGYQSTNFNLTVIPTGLQEVIKISGNLQQGPVNTTLAQPLVAGVTFAAAVVAQGAPITFEVIGGGATFVESGTSTFSAPPAGAQLSASVNVRLGAEVGGVQVRASFPGMLPTVFDATGLPSSSTLSLIKTAGDAQIATTGLVSNPLRVRLSNGATPIADADINWAVSTGDATLVTSTTRTNAQGEAETTLQIGPTTGSIRVRATATVVGEPTQPTTEFTLTAANAMLTAVSGSGQGGAIGSNSDQVFVFELKRADGSLLPGQTVQFTASSGTLTQSSAISGSDGRVSVGLRYGGTPGSVQVSASAFGNRVSAIGVANTFVPLLTIASGNNQSANAGASLTDPLVIAVSRPPGAALAKGLQGLTVNWSVVSGGGALSSATSITDTNGRSSNTLRLGSAVGAQQVRASIAGVGEVVFVATAGIPANSVLEIVSGNNQKVVPRRPSAPLVVRLRTSAGAGLSGFVVRFTPSDGVSLDPVEATTNADGRASTIANVTLPGDYTITASLPSLTTIPAVTFNLGNGIANLPELAGRGNRIARAIDKACPRLAQSAALSPAQQDLLQRCSELVINARDNPGTVVTALDTMLADESSAQNNAALASASAQFENLKGRFAALRSGSRGVSMGGLAFVTPDGRLPFSFLPSNLLLGAAEDQPAPVTESFARWGFFATGTIGRGSRDPSADDPGGDFDNYGVTAGIDYRLTDSFILGGALGFNNNKSALNRNQGGLDSKGYSLSAYGTWFKGDSYYGDGVLTFGRNSTDITRRISYTIPGLSGGATTTINQVATGSPDSDQQSFALSFGRDFNRGALSFGPYLRGTYTKLDFDGYVERMSDPNGPGAGLALAVDGRTLTSLQAVIGGKMGYTVSTSWGVLMPSLQIEYVKELKEDTDGLVTRFAFDPTNTSIVIDGDQIDSDFLNIGLGLSGVFANGRSGYVYYEHVAGRDRTSQDSLAIGIRIEF